MRKQKDLKTYLFKPNIYGENLINFVLFKQTNKNNDVSLCFYKKSKGMKQIYTDRYHSNVKPIHVLHQINTYWNQLRNL